LQQIRLIYDILWKLWGGRVSAEDWMVNWINYIAPLVLIKDMHCIIGIFLFSMLSAAYFPSVNTENFNKGFHRIILNFGIQFSSYHITEST
jgi:hypothetical protein